MYRRGAYGKHELAEEEISKQRFCREARSAASVTHENVVAVHQVEKIPEKGIAFLVMQLISGETLEQRLQRETKLPLAEIVRISMEASRGLAAAHAQGLIHRDIKPGNILLEPPQQKVKLTDFGLALDPAADTYFLIQASLVNMPVVAENLGLMRAQGTGFLSQNLISPEGGASLIALNKRAQEAQGEMTRNLARAGDANADIKATLDAKASAGRTYIEKALGLADTASCCATTLAIKLSLAAPCNTYTFQGWVLVPLGARLAACSTACKTSRSTVCAV